MVPGARVRATTRVERSTPRSTSWVTFEDHGEAELAPEAARPLLQPHTSTALNSYYQQHLRPAGEPGAAAGLPG